MFILQIIASIGGPGGTFDFTPRRRPAAEPPVLAANPPQTNYNNRVLFIDPYQCSRCGGGSQRRTEGFRLSLSGYAPDLSALLRPSRPIDPQILEQLLRR